MFLHFTKFIYFRELMLLSMTIRWENISFSKQSLKEEMNYTKNGLNLIEMILLISPNRNSWPFFEQCAFFWICKCQGLGLVYYSFLHLQFSMGMLIFAGLGYALEKDEPDTMFYTLPQTLYWAIITMTSTGYGDIAPRYKPWSKYTGVDRIF